MFVHKKKFGQNFLHNRSVIDKIINHVDLSTRHIVEIGMGHGALTKELIIHGGSVSGFEIDRELFDYIRTNLSGDNIKHYFVDFLAYNDQFPNNSIIVSNPPYNISSQIIFKFLEKPFYSEAILMFQAELACRILASPCEKTYGKLTVLVDTFCIKEKVVKVDKKYFNPMPQVDSLVFYLKKKDKCNIDKEQYESYLSFLNGCFLMKRKKLINNLVHYLKVDKSVLSFLGDLLDKRPEEISYLEYERIYKLINERNVFFL